LMTLVLSALEQVALQNSKGSQGIKQIIFS
jgi:hypothetical protein